MSRGAPLFAETRPLISLEREKPKKKINKKVPSVLGRGLTRIFYHTIILDTGKILPASKRRRVLAFLTHFYGYSIILRNSYIRRASRNSYRDTVPGTARAFIQIYSRIFLRIYIDTREHSNIKTEKRSRVILG